MRPKRSGRRPSRLADLIGEHLRVTGTEQHNDE
jgi:hypothetical protein